MEWMLVTGLLAALWVGVDVVLLGSPYLFQIMYSQFLSVVGFILTYNLIPPFAEKLKARGLFGKDLNKPGKDVPVPEALGIIPGTVFLVCVILSQFMFSSDAVKLLEYNAGLLSICFMILLGFVDDVIDLAWRYKLMLPTFASLPLLIAYRGSTSILIPKWIASLMSIPHLINLGYFYHLYMGLLAIFCTNSINILAGVNGLEVGQSVVITVATILHNLLELFWSVEDGTADDNPFASMHLFSLLISFPFLACSLGLLCHNWYPSRVFVGDTFTYFAGMFFAVAGILGHFNKTLLLLFIPQLLNTILSLPQLLGVIPCPRHRIPRCNPNTGLLEPTPNLTLLNFTLRLFGPMTEKRLVQILLLFQVLCCAGGLVIRHYSSLMFFFV